MERDGHSLSFSFSLADRIWGPLVSMLKQAGARFWLGTQLSHPWPGHCGSLAATRVRINRSECEKHKGNKATAGTTSNSLAQHDPYQKDPAMATTVNLLACLFFLDFFFLPLSVSFQRQATEHKTVCLQWTRNGCVTQHNQSQSEHIYTAMWSRTENCKPE